MPEGVSAATQIVMLDASGFLGIPNGKYDLVIIDVHAMTELYFIFLESLWAEDISCNSNLSELCMLHMLYSNFRIVYF